MTHRGKGESNRRKWTRAEFFAHAKNKQAEKWLTDTLLDINQQSFDRKVTLRQEIKELKDSLRPLKCTTGHCELTTESPEEIETPVGRKTVKFAADVKSGGLDSLPSDQSTAKDASYKHSKFQIMVRANSEMGVPTERVTAPKNRPSTTGLALKVKRTSGEPEVNLNAQLKETLVKNTELCSGDMSQGNHVIGESNSTSSKVKVDKVSPALKKLEFLPVVFEIQKAKDKKAEEQRNKKKCKKLLGRQSSGVSRGDTESMGSTRSYDFSLDASTTSDTLNDSQYMESDLHTVPVFIDKKQQNSESNTERVQEENVDYNSKDSSSQTKESEDDIDKQIMQVMRDEVEEELEKLEGDDTRLDDDSRPTSQQGDRYNLYSVNYSSLKLSTAKKRVIGRGQLEKPKWLIEKEMAMKMFTRTITTALANSKFREVAEKPADDTDVPPKKSGQEETRVPLRRAKSAPVPIAQFVRAVEAGLGVDHISVNAINLRVPFSQARVKRERENLMQKPASLRVDPEAERHRMKEIQGRIHSFLRCFPRTHDDCDPDD